MNVPIYRAKKIDSDELVEGYYYQELSGTHWIDSRMVSKKAFDFEYKIDPSTLAIHFPSMLDSEGNKIFASLSEDGKGGDVLKAERDIIYICQYYAHNQEFVFNDISIHIGLNTPLSGLRKTIKKVIGIQK